MKSITETRRIGKRAFRPGRGLMLGKTPLLAPKTRKKAEEPSSVPWHLEGTQDPANKGKNSGCFPFSSEPLRESTDYLKVLSNKIKSHHFILVYTLI